MGFIRRTLEGRLAQTGAFVLFFCLGGPLAMSSEPAPLSVNLSVQDRTIHLTVTNVSKGPLKIWRSLDWGREGDISPLIFDIRDRNNRAADLNAFRYYRSPKPNDWILLAPGKSIQGGVAIDEISREYVLRRDTYSMRAIYHWQYYTGDGRPHPTKIESNLVKIVSRTDIKADFCAGHFPDGKPVPRELIEQRCSKQ